MVSAIDGVGTKLMIAQAMKKHNTVGIDLVAMNVNDLVVQGAEPLSFTDYIGCSKYVISRRNPSRALSNPGRNSKECVSGRPPS